MLGSLQLKLIALGGILLGILAVIARFFYLGKASAKADDAGRKLRTVRKANEIRDSVSRVDDNELRDRLRKSGWLRD